MSEIQPNAPKTFNASLIILLAALAIIAAGTILLLIWYIRHHRRSSSLTSIPSSNAILQLPDLDYWFRPPLSNRPTWADEAPTYCAVAPQMEEVERDEAGTGASGGGWAAGAATRPAVMSRQGSRMSLPPPYSVAVASPV